ncbi:Cysteine desulfurase [Handroanthus impetiginosus]|uniref:Cysteine desulfurase n=1 Tax=Handroanthus impetiginosus TaxID=429701 RepID=A0A2G9HSV1_9LAMI|nr:Cysteine desulfurase [Handroanthus impetiginosus]
MEFEHLPHYLLGENLKTHNLLTNIASSLGGGGGGGFTGDDEDDIYDSGSHGIKSFDHFLDQNGTLPRSNDPTEKKLRWLRSQIIGGTAEFNTPFGRRLLTYADHTASGRSLHYIENFIKHNLLPFYGNSHTSDSYVGYRTTKMVHEAANYVKKCLGGGEDDPIMFCGSGSTAAIKRLQEVMGLAIPSILRERMLKCLSNEERWVVLVGPYEHHSNILSWRESLAEVVEIRLDHHGLIDMEELREKLEFYKAKNRPILGSFSACSNVTGICTNTRANARLLHRFGGFVCFDFAASGPYKKIDMKSGQIDGYDAIFLSVHKFLGGPASPGIVLMNKALYRLGSSPPSTCGGGTVNFVNGYDNKVVSRSFILVEIGRPISLCIRCFGNSASSCRCSFLVIFLKRGWDDQQKKGLDLWRETQNKRGKPLHGPFVAKLLNDLFGIQARGGCACAGPYGHMLLNVNEPHSLTFRSVIQKGYAGIKPGWTRVSFPYYMSEEEFEFILTAIEFIAIYGQRFLPWYHFSWRTGSWTFKKDVLRDNYNNVLSGIIKTLNMECNENQENKKVDMSSKYTNYLETAKQIASLLPKFPPQRKIPEEIDIDLVPFVV